jgi:Ca2+-binding RTX toxin-like protein
MAEPTTCTVRTTTTSSFGDDGSDTAHGGAVVDDINGELGDDFLYGEDGNDNITGGDGVDLIQGEADDDALWGQADNDVIYGGTGADGLHGGSGNDDCITGGQLGDTWTSDCENVS